MVEVGYDERAEIGFCKMKIKAESDKRADHTAIDALFFLENRGCLRLYRHDEQEKYERAFGHHKKRIRPEEYERAGSQDDQCRQNRCKLAVAIGDIAGAEEGEKQRDTDVVFEYDNARGVADTPPAWCIADETEEQCAEGGRIDERSGWGPDEPL